jgi:Flp pilus assembly protein TadG
MIRFIAYLVTSMFMLRTRMEQARRDERGLGTLEMVIIALGLFLIATAAIAVITGAINTRINQIQ